MKSLAVAIICIVTAACGSREKPADPLVGLEASEKVAVLHLNQEDRERYLRNRPLAVIREYLSASQMRPEEIASDLVAVQRARRSNTESGWRMIMVGGRSLLVFHVSDDRQWKVQVRDRLDDDNVWKKCGKVHRGSIFIRTFESSRGMMEARIQFDGMSPSDGAACSAILRSRS